MKEINEINKDLKNVSNQLKLIQKSVETITKTSMDDAFKISEELQKSQKALKKIKGLPQLLVDVEKTLEGISDDNFNKKKSRTMEFLSSFQKRMREDGRDVKGQIPTLYHSIFSWTLDNKNGEVIFWYGREKEIIGKYPMDVEILFQAFIQTEKQLNDSNFNETEFLEDLFKAYRMQLAAQERSIGHPAPISEVFSLYNYILNQKNDTDVTCDRMTFSHKLFRLKRRDFGKYKFGMNVATLHSTKKAENVFPILKGANGESQMVSEIVFTEVSK